MTNINKKTNLQQQINYLQTYKVIIEAIRNVLKEEMNYFNGVDYVIDYYFNVSAFLKNINLSGKFTLKYVDEIIHKEAIEIFKGYPLECYGWTLDNVEIAILKQLTIKELKS